MVEEHRPQLFYQLSSNAQLRILRRAGDAASNGIVITDAKSADNVIIYSNPAFSKISGYGIDEIIGRNCRFLQQNDRNQPEVNSIREAIRERQPITTVIKNYRKDGSLFWNELTISPVYDEAQELVNFVGIQNDVSARKEAETRISEFYSVISHELRTPLSSINGALGIIHDGSAGKVNRSVMKLIDIALSNSERLMRLIGEILDWKKIEVGKFKLCLSETEPKQVIDIVMADMVPIAKQHNVFLSEIVKDNDLISLDVDRTVQVLNNLAMNAIKYSPASGRVVICVEKINPATIRFSVTDEGPGIEPDQLNKLFVHFQQLDSSDSRQKGGSGLGLAISKSLVELHGGCIGVESQPGLGSTFYFEYPSSIKE
jgi:PAS domain S-box-containing protein